MTRSFLDTNLLEGLDGEEEMVVRRITDATGVEGEAIVEGERLGDPDDDGSAGSLTGTPTRARANVAACQPRDRGKEASWILWRGGHGERDR
jgi:hypothetical protein